MITLFMESAMSAAHETSVERPFESLLVPVELTPSSKRVAARVAHLPLAENARIRLLHVVSSGLLSSRRAPSAAEACRLLEDEARELASRVPAGVVIDCVVAAGNPSKTIAQHAVAMGAQLIVLGRRGANTLRDAFFGSTAERVVRRTRIPVLVVRLDPRGAYSRPALALDLDDSVNDVVPLFLRLGATRRRMATVIHAFDTAYRRRLYGSLSFDGAESHRQKYRRHYMLEMASRLAVALVLAAVPAKRAPTWNLHVRYGAPRAVIQSAVRNEGVDLLVLGTHAYSGLTHALLGTVAGDVLREVACDVLVVPPREPAETDHGIGATAS